MDLEIKLWDDTRGQVIQFYLAKLFRRGNSNKTKLLYHFRICKINPDDSNLIPILEIINRESMLSDWEALLNALKEILYARVDNACFTPIEKDISLKFNRILTTPQIATEINIDGIAYLMQSPGITEHMSVAFKFMTTNDLLKAFSAKLYQILQNREFRSNIEQLPQPILRTTLEPEGEEDEEDDEQLEYEEETEIESDLVVKDTKASTEMLEKRESSVQNNDQESAQDAVIVQDWDEEEVDEVGGTSNKPKNSSENKIDAAKEKPTQATVEKDDDDVSEIESQSKENDKALDKVKDDEESQTDDDKNLTADKIDTVEELEATSKTKEKKAEPPKKAKKTRKTDKKETSEKPKEKAKPKRKTAVKKSAEKTLLDVPEKPKKKPGRKPATKKKTIEKKDTKKKS